MGTDTIKQTEQGAHRITLTGRHTMEICGVRDVISFDEQVVVLETADGGLEILGENLHVRVLSLESGIVTLDGRVDSVTYTDTDGEKIHHNGLFSRLFHS